MPRGAYSLLYGACEGIAIRRQMQQGPRWSDEGRAGA